jgi:L-amino acid N-acyltransferase YncA
MPDTITREKDKPLLVQAVDRFDFRPAVADDIPALLDLYRDFYEESDFPARGLTYDPERMSKWIAGAIDRGDIPHILAVEKHSGRLVGSICYMLNHTCTTEAFAELNKFYVRQAWRRSAVGRVLATLCLEIARADGAVSFNAGIAAGTDASASLANLFIKLGFSATPGVAFLYRRL